MAKAEAAHQTVEQILASIRNAISDDEARRSLLRSAGRQPATPAADESEAAPEAAATADDAQTQGVINLAIEKAIDGVRAELSVNGEKSEPAAEPRAAANGTNGAERPSFAQAAAARAQARFQAMPSRTEARPLLSARSGAAVSASFDTLARSVAPGNSRKLEELVEGMLRPMLRSWLDDNLPLLVERLVREEIERVSRSGR
jgi:cell pole-organizing protein PopZ